MLPALKLVEKLRLLICCKDGVKRVRIWRRRIARIKKINKKRKCDKKLHNTTRENLQIAKEAKK